MVNLKRLPTGEWEVRSPDPQEVASACHILGGVPGDPESYPKQPDGQFLGKLPLSALPAFAFPWDEMVLRTVGK